MTTTLTYQNVRISGVLTLKTLHAFHMESRLNNHARAYISGIVDEEMYAQAFGKQLKGGTVCVYAGDDTRPLFCGIILDVKITYENDYYGIEIWLISGTYLLDTKKKSRSYQDIEMTYRDVIKQTLADTESADCILTAGRDAKISAPLIQYLETDWEFAKRLASHFNVSLIPELTMGRPKFWFGMRNSYVECPFDEDEYTITVSKRFFEAGGEAGGFKRRDFLYYLVKSYNNYQIGDPTVFKGKSLVICEKECSLEKGIAVFQYKLALPSFLAGPKQYNEKICGMSILGTVLETDKETLKIHLDIDPVQDTATAYPYAWVPATGNLMYLMPKVGTRVSLYFYNHDERSAKAVNCVRTNGDGRCAEIADYNNRCLTTEHGKQMYIFPTMMGLAGTSNSGTPLHMQIDDEEGVTFQSHKTLNLIAAENITVNAPVFRMQSMTELLFTHAALTVQGDGENIPYNVLAHPIATISMADALTTLQGEYTRYAGWEYTSYPPFDDAPVEGKFNWGEMCLKHIGRSCRRCCGWRSRCRFGISYRRSRPAGASCSWDKCNGRWISSSRWNGNCRGWAYRYR